MNLKTLQQLATDHGVPLRTMHQRREDRKIEGTHIGRTRVFNRAEQRALLKVGKRGRPRKKRC